jgi:transposase-like protein
MGQPTGETIHVSTTGNLLGGVEKQGGHRGIRGFHTINKLASQYGAYPHQISVWKAQLLVAALGVFSGQTDQRENEAEAVLNFDGCWS